MPSKQSIQPWPVVKFHGSVGENARTMRAIEVLGTLLQEDSDLSAFIDRWIEQLGARGKATYNLPPEHAITEFVQERLKKRKKFPADIPVIHHLVISILRARFKAASVNGRADISFTGSPTLDAWARELTDDDRRAWLEKRKWKTDSGETLPPGPRKPVDLPEGQGFAEYVQWWYLYRWVGTEVTDIAHDPSKKGTAKDDSRIRKEIKKIDAILLRVTLS